LRYGIFRSFDYKGATPALQTEDCGESATWMLCIATAAISRLYPFLHASPCSLGATWLSLHPKVAGLPAGWFAIQAAYHHIDWQLLIAPFMLLTCPARLAHNCFSICFWSKPAGRVLG